MATPPPSSAPYVPSGPSYVPTETGAAAAADVSLAAPPPQRIPKEKYTWKKKYKPYGSQVSKRTKLEIARQLQVPVAFHAGVGLGAQLSDADVEKAVDDLSKRWTPLTNAEALACFDKNCTAYYNAIKAEYHPGLNPQEAKDHLNLLKSAVLHLQNAYGLSAKDKDLVPRTKRLLKRLIEMQKAAGTYVLQHSERLQIVDFRPTILAELHLCVKDIDVRLTEEEQEDILQAVKEHSPPKRKPKPVAAPSLSVVPGISNNIPYSSRHHMMGRRGGMGGVPHQGGPSPSGGRGRGRDLVKPAWMTAESSAGAEEKTSETN